MRGNRHPITEVGIGRIIALVGRDIRQSAKVSGDEVRFVDFGTRRVFGRPARCVEAVTPGGAAYYAYRATICIDLDVGLPVQVTIRDERDQIVEQYGYERLQTNPGLTDSDFDPSNSAYGF
jgi:negative regulator of sigma E activity